MPNITEASVAVTSFPNRFVSPFGNEGVIPFYSSIPLGSPAEGCLACVVCGNSTVRSRVIADAGSGRYGFFGPEGVSQVTIAPVHR